MKVSLIIFGILLTGLAFGQDPVDSDDKNIDIENEEVEANAVTTDAPQTTTITTVAPTTTTTASPTTTPITPADPDDEPKDTVRYYLNEDNKTCIMLEMKGKLEFSYMKKDDDNTTKSTQIAYDMPKNSSAGGSAVVSGYCTKGNVTTQELTITFFEDWVMTFLFNKTKDTYEVQMMSLKYTLSDARFPNNTETDKEYTSTKNKAQEYSVDLESSFRCDSKQTIDGFSGGNLTDFMTWDLKVEAYRTKDDYKFGDATACDADTKVSNLVPIIVGAALAGLVLIVLVAYLIGRQRNKRGYQSV